MAYRDLGGDRPIAPAPSGFNQRQNGFNWGDLIPAGLEFLGNMFGGASASKQRRRELEEARRQFDLRHALDLKRFGLERDEHGMRQRAEARHTAGLGLTTRQRLEILDQVMSRLAGMR